jgi:hypothetical protein
MIPEFDSDGNLPPGIHSASWREFISRFGTTRHRQKLLKGLRLAINSLKTAGCNTVYIGGSFVTAKRTPNDFDACWVADSVDWDLLKRIEPVLLDFTNQRAAQKAKFYGELFLAGSVETRTRKRFLDFFQIDKETLKQKGIITLDLWRL